MSRLIDADRLDALVKLTLQKIMQGLPAEDTEANKMLKCTTLAAFSTFADMIRDAPTEGKQKDV